MKTNSIVSNVVFLTLWASVVACSNEQVSSEENVNRLAEFQERIDDFRGVVARTSCSIYENAYDGRTIDVESMMDILESCNPTDDESLGAYRLIETKSDYGGSWDSLSEAQRHLMQIALDMAENNHVDYNLLYSYCDELDSEEGLEMALAFFIIEAVESGISDANCLIETKGFSWSSFGCNLATSALGSIYGAWGAAVILGTVTGGAFTVVCSAIAIGSGALLSAGLC